MPGPPSPLDQGTTLGRCPWCRSFAVVWQEHDGWLAGCRNVEHATGPAGCIIQPHTLPMTTRTAAMREWRRGLRG